MNRVLEYIISAKDRTAAAISSVKTRFSHLAKSASGVKESISKELGGASAAVGRFTRSVTSNLGGRLISAFKRAHSAVGGFAKGVGQNLTNIQSGFQMLSGAASRFVGLFQTSLEQAFNFEKATTDFKVLLGSADAAKKHILELREFAAKTPFTLPDLQNASKLLLSFGSNVDDIMPSLKMLGDIALGDSQKFQGLSLVFAQVKSAGRLMGQDLLQMINQGFNPLTIISKETGKSMLELKKDMENGAISFEMVEGAMRKATQAGGLFGGAMEEASKTGHGLFSTLQDNWMMTLQQFGEGFMDVAKVAMQWFMDKLEELRKSGAIEEWAEKARRAMITVLGLFEALSETSTREQAFGAIKDIIIGSFEAAASKAVSLLKEAAPIIGALIAKGMTGLKDLLEEMQYESVAKHQAEKEIADRYKSRGESMYEERKKPVVHISAMGGAVSTVQTEFVMKEEAKREIEEYAKQLEAEMRRNKADEIKQRSAAMVAEFGEDDGANTSRLERGLKTLKSFGERVQAEIEERAKKAAEGSSGNNKPNGTGEKKTVQQMAQERLEAAEREKREKEELKLIQKLEQERIRAEEKMAREAIRNAEREHALRVRYAQEEAAMAEGELSQAEQRAQAAQNAVSQAWGWYRNPETMREYAAEQEANQKAQRQFQKDYKSLIHGRWSDEFSEAKDLQRRGRYDKLEERMTEWRKGHFGLSAEEEATMRVALAQDAEKDAMKNLADISENTSYLKSIADALTATEE